MRGLKEYAKERSLATGTGGGRRGGRSSEPAYPYPSRLQWVGLCWVAAKNGVPTGTAGGARTAASMERRGWIVWTKPDGAKWPGYVLTPDGVVAKHAGDRRFANQPEVAS